MKKYIHLSLMALLVYGISGCAENQTRIGEGAGAGGLLGAGLGGIIGHQSGNGWEGALIGGAAGAAGGAMIGSQIDKPYKPTPTDQIPGQPTAGQPVNYAQPASVTPLTMQQIVNLTKQGQTSDQIIAQIQSSHATYVMNSDDLSYLRSNGVSQRVIEYMQATK